MGGLITIRQDKQQSRVGKWEMGNGNLELGVRS